MHYAVSVLPLTLAPASNASAWMPVFLARRLGCAMWLVIVVTPPGSLAAASSLASLELGGTVFDLSSSFLARLLRPTRPLPRVLCGGPSIRSSRLSCRLCPSAPAPPSCALLAWTLLRTWCQPQAEAAAPPPLATQQAALLHLPFAHLRALEAEAAAPPA